MECFFPLDMALFGILQKGISYSAEGSIKALRKWEKDQMGQWIYGVGEIDSLKLSTKFFKKFRKCWYSLARRIYLFITNPVCGVSTETPHQVKKIKRPWPAASGPSKSISKIHV